MKTVLLVLLDNKPSQAVDVSETDGNVSHRIDYLKMKGKCEMLKHIVAVVAGLSLLAGSASAGLILAIDTENQTFSFSGVDSGHSELNSSYQTASWATDGYASLESMSFSSYSLNISNAFEEETASWNQTRLTVTDHAFTQSLYIEISTADSDIPSLAGTGNTFSYANADELFRATLEEHIGRSIYLHKGEGYSEMAVTAVPEPTTIALLSLGGIALLRRKRKK